MIRLVWTKRAVKDLSELYLYVDETHYLVETHEKEEYIKIHFIFISSLYIIVVGGGKMAQLRQSHFDAS